MNMKKTLIGLAIIGISTLPLSYAQSSELPDYEPAEFTYQVKNLIGIEQAATIVNQHSTGKVIHAALETDEGAPQYQFVLSEQDLFRIIYLHAELGTVLHNKTVDLSETPALYSPSVSLSDAVSAAETELNGEVFAAELDQYENHAAYHLFVYANDADYDVTVSADTGNVLTIEQSEVEDSEDDFAESDYGDDSSYDSDQGEYEGMESESFGSNQMEDLGSSEFEDGLENADALENGESLENDLEDKEGTFIKPIQAITTAEQTTGGTAVAFEWEIDETSGDDSSGVYWVETQNNNLQSFVAINDVTGEVVESYSESEDDLAEYTNLLAKAAGLDKIIDEAKTHRSGTLLGLAYDDEGEIPVYQCLFLADNKMYLVTLNAVDAALVSNAEIEDLDAFEEELSEYYDELSWFLGDSL